MHLSQRVFQLKNPFSKNSGSHCRTQALTAFQRHCRQWTSVIWDCPSRGRTIGSQRVRGRGCMEDEGVLFTPLPQLLQLSHVLYVVEGCRDVIWLPHVRPLEGLSQRTQVHRWQCLWRCGESFGPTVRTRILQKWLFELENALGQVHCVQRQLCWEIWYDNSDFYTWH